MTNTLCIQKRFILWRNGILCIYFYMVPFYCHLSCRDMKRASSEFQLKIKIRTKTDRGHRRNQIQLILQCGQENHETKSMNDAVLLIIKYYFSFLYNIFTISICGLILLSAYDWATGYLYCSPEYSQCDVAHAHNLHDAPSPPSSPTRF